MRASFRAATLVALSLSALLAACGDDDGPSPSSRSAAVFVNADHIEWDTTSWDQWNTGSNGYSAIVHAGFQVDSFSGLDVAAINAHVAGKDIFFFPTLDNAPPFTAEAIDSIRAFVNNGGTVVVLGAGSEIDVFNDMFDLALDADGTESSRLPIPRMPGAGETPFGDGAGTVPENDGTDYIIAATLPDSAIIAYGEPEGGDDAAVVVIPYGEGRIVFFGWDWADGKPKGYQDGGWNGLLSLTAGF